MARKAIWPLLCLLLLGGGAFLLLERPDGEKQTDSQAAADSPTASKARPAPSSSLGAIAPSTQRLSQGIPDTIAPNVTNELQGRIVFRTGSPAIGVTLRVERREDERLAPRIAITGEEGEFSIEDLSGSCMASLEIERPFQFTRTGSRTVEVTIPDPQLLLEIERIPTITGRVIWPHVGNGVPNARVLARLVGVRRVIAASADEDGMFELPITTKPPGEIPLVLQEIKVGTAGFEGLRVIVLNRSIDDGLELGNLALAETWAIEFVVLDDSGRPIQGATAGIIVDKGYGGHSSPTDGAGRGTLHASGGGFVDAVFGALGYRQKRRAVAKAEEVPIEVVLERAAVLEVTVHAEREDDIAEMKVSVTGTVPAAPNPASQHQYLPAGESPRLATETAGDRVTVTLLPVSTGRFVLTLGEELAAHQPMTLEVRDRYGALLIRNELSPVASGDRRTVEVSPRRGQSSLLGEIEADGRPVSEAWVLVSAGGSASVRGTSDARGQFSFDGLRDGEVTVRVFRQGYAPFEKSVSIEPPSTSMRITLSHDE